MEPVFFSAADGIRLEGLFRGDENQPGAVITHPHPLYGGTMNNYVVEAVDSALREKGYATLRFNFRGVGRSDGRYGAGIDEAEDLKGALAYLQNRGITPAILAGYSFGTRVCANVPADMQPAAMVMIAPPVAMMDFTDLQQILSLKLIITGENDELAPPGQIRQYIARWNPDATLHVIEGEDHFFGKSIPELKQILYRIF